MITDLNIRRIEKEAKKYFDCTKLEDNSYIVKSNMGYTEKIQYNFRQNKKLSEKIRSEIGKLKVTNGDFITISVKEEFDKIKILEIISLTNMDHVSVSIESDLDYNEREDLVNFVADVLKNNGVDETLIGFYLHYDFETLERVIENIKNMK